MRKQKAVQETVQQTAEVTRTDMLEAFSELVAERYGYFTARRLTQQDMSEKCKAEIEAVNEKRKALNENIEKLLEAEDAEARSAIKVQAKELKTLKETADTAKKPFLEKIKPLSQAQKYCDSVAIPDSLKELGHQVQPLFSLSDWMTKALEQSKQKKKK
jgi:seryl-tRNA synthetase